MINIMQFFWKIVDEIEPQHDGYYINDHVTESQRIHQTMKDEWMQSE